MSTKIQICNDALNFLGAEAINSLEDNNHVARTCKQQYPLARDYVLRTHPWNFALERDVLTPHKEAWGGSHQFLLPSDCVRINKVLNSDLKPVKYKVEGRNIFSPETTIYLSYVSGDVLEGVYDPAFKRAVAAQMAGDMCYKITQSGNLMQSMYALADEFAKNSRTLDSMENTPDDFKFDYYDNARRSNHEIYPIDYEL